MSHLNTAHEPIWMDPPQNEEVQDLFIKEFNIHPVTAEILASRGFDSVEMLHEFLYAQLPNLPSPELFPEMKQATSRLMQAYEKHEAILIYGDNDVDGMTGTALLTDFFRNLGLQVYFYLPNRGSALENPLKDALEFCLEKSCSLIITVDCGITAGEELKLFDEKNIDVIITDHHEPTDKLPHTAATLNPKLLNSTYPNRNLTGVGVAFKLAHAFTNHLISKGCITAEQVDLKHFLDLVALGTIADMGALIDENRILVRYGINQLHKTKRIGLVKLIKVCGLKINDLNTLDIASKIAPRLNSLGRIADPLKGVELLLIRDAQRAEVLAQELDLKNLERQQIEKKDSEDIEQILALHPEILEDKAIILYSEKWHPGIIPIISARIAKQYNRPTIIIAIDSDLEVGKGSIRTIPEFPVLSTLKSCADLLTNFGGHDFAAGLTIKRENIKTFKKRFTESANEKLKDQDVYPKLILDAKAGFADLTFDFLESLSLLEPFGNENPAPILTCEARQVWPPKIVGKTHLKLFLEENDRFLEGIGFGLAHRKSSLLQKNLKLRIAFTPQVNNYLNKSSIQLQIRDFKILDGDA